MQDLSELNKTEEEIKPVPLVQLIGLQKSFGEQIVLKGIDLEIYNNEFVTLLGPSGCGKTTTLRIIGGFEMPSNGKVLFSGKDVSRTPAYLRPTNTVFQRYALFPHLSVHENIAFGPRTFYRKKNHVSELVSEMIDRFIFEQKWPYPVCFALKKGPNSENWMTLIEQYEIKEKHDLDKVDPVTKMTYRQIIHNDIKANTLSKINVKYLVSVHIQSEVQRLLKLVGLEGYGERSVTKLSGGQQQRVAIARALINRPRLLLLDEPLGALDLKLRQEMQYELKEIQRKTGITFIYVTHDQEEALTMSDKIVVMQEGVILQIGTPQQIYNEPINRFVAKFIGESNIIEGVYLDEESVLFDGRKFKCVDTDFIPNQKVDIVIRPEDIEIVYPSKGKLLGVVDSVVFKGVHFETNVMTDKREYTIHTTKYYPVGRQVGLNFQPDDMHLMEPSQ